MKNVVVDAETLFDDDYMDSVLHVADVAASRHYLAHVVPLVIMARRMTMKSPAVVALVAAVDEGDP